MVRGGQESVQGEASVSVFSGWSMGSVGRWLMGGFQGCAGLAGFVAGRVQCVGLGGE
jgi:hypothetical protein